MENAIFVDVDTSDSSSTNDAIVISDNEVEDSWISSWRDDGSAVNTSPHSESQYPFNLPLPDESSVTQSVKNYDDRITEKFTVVEINNVKPVTALRPAKRTESSHDFSRQFVEGYSNIENIVTEDLSKTKIDEDKNHQYAFPNRFKLDENNRSNASSDNPLLRLTSQALLVFVRGRGTPAKQVIACHISDNGVPQEIMQRFIAHIKEFTQKNGLKMPTMSIRETTRNLQKFGANEVPDEKFSEEDLMNQQRLLEEEKIRKPSSKVSKIFVCELCKKIFARKSQLDNHLVNHHDPDPDPKKPFACDVCDRRFLQSALLKRHKLVHNSNANLFMCDVCGKGFRRKDNLRSHMLTHESNPTLKYMCDVCGKGFTKPNGLKAHSLIHDDGVKSLFACDICGKAFTQQYYLKTHRMKHESDLSLRKPFTCPVCNGRFTQYSSLKTHVFLLHESTPDAKRRFECDVCEKGFFLKNQWKRHMLIHSDAEKPFVCEICEKRFIRKDHLKRHSMSHSSSRSSKTPPTCMVKEENDPPEELIEEIEIQPSIFVHNPVEGDTQL